VPGFLPQLIACSTNERDSHRDPEDPADNHRGNYWDHLALDAESKLVLAVVPEARDVENIEAVVAEAQDRTGWRMMDLMTRDDYPGFETPILQAYGQMVTITATGRSSRKTIPEKVQPPGMNYATVEKRREKGRVVEVITRVVFGTMAAVQAALLRLRVSRWINGSFLERQNATDRHHNARKVRKTYTFSKDWRAHEAMTYYTMYSYNFCWPVRTLDKRDDAGSWQRRTPAIGAGLADHVWTMCEWITLSGIQRR
jgi:hypothetical protein